MTPRKDGINQHLEERSRTVSSDLQRANNDENLDTRDVSQNLQQGNEGQEDEELDNNELTEADFDIDEDDEEEQEEEEEEELN